MYINRRMAISGAAGDLTFRFLLPALAELHEAGRLPDGYRDGRAGAR